MGEQCSFPSCENEAAGRDPKHGYLTCSNHARFFRMGRLLPINEETTR